LDEAKENMKVKYTQFVPDPSLRGTTTHLPAHIAQVLIASGQATAVPFPRRDGSPEWMAAIAEEDAARKPSHHDTVGGLAPGVTEWGCKALASGKAVIVRRVGGETNFLDSPPVECPISVQQQYFDLCAVSPEQNSITLEAARDAQAKQEFADKTAGRLSVFGALFGSKPLGRS
jgi:hypothetical protein